jgi:DNA polymerase-3 subunit epsilon
VHLVALDTETCALGPGRDRIVQFCAVELDERLQIQSQWTELVNPGRPIPPSATAIHGITDAMVRDKPTFAFFAGRLRQLIRPDTVFIAYNAGFDRGVLNLEWDRLGIPGIPDDQAILDPLQIERKVLSRSLGPTYTRYTGKKLENAHTADADTLAMVEVLRAQRNVHADKLPPTLRDLVQWTSQASPGRPPRRSHLYAESDGVLRLGFGKHAGRPAHEVPEYLTWMMGEDFPERTKRKARKVLETLSLEACS